MSYINTGFKFQTHDSAWFTTNATLILGDGEPAYHIDGRYKLGDGTTQLSALSFLGASGGGTWGSITGTLSAQTDLQSALNAKQATLVSATNIKTINGTTILGAGDLTVSGADATKLAILNNLSDLNNTATARTNIGLGNVDNTSDINKPISAATQTALDNKVDENASITGATKTKITYDSKGLVTSGADATTADIADSSNKRYVTDAQLVVIGNTSNTNSGNETTSTLGVTINAATAATPNDTDLVATVDASLLKKITWTNVKAFLKTYFDTLYLTAASLTNYFNKSVDDTDDITVGTTNKFATAAEKTKIGFITVTQAVDLDTIESDTATNNAKVTNATHTGEVTGSGSLTVDKTAITNKSAVTMVGADYVLFSDTSDSGNLKKGLISDILGGAGDMLLGTAQTVTASKTFLATTLLMRNVANTFSSLFTNTNTAARTYTLQDRDGTLADDTDLATKTNKLITANRQTASYTLVLGDADKLVEMNVGSANNLTIPLNATVTYPIGTQILVSQYGAGQTTIVATGGVTINDAADTLKLRVQNSSCTLVKIGTNEWYAWGDFEQTATGVSTLTADSILAFGSEDDTAVNTISSALITAANIKSFSYVCKSNATTSLDDFKLNGVTFNIENIVDSTSFDIRATAANNATGNYTIKYLINY